MALRLIIEVVGEEFHLVHKSSPEMTLPAASSAESGEGVVAELRGERDEPLYRQNLSSQLDPGFEVFSQARIQRVELPGRKRTLVLLLPDDARARDLVFLRTTADSSGTSRKTSDRPEELGRITLIDKGAT